MQEELVTTESILHYLQEKVEQKEQLPPSTWIDAAMKLAALIGNENDKLFDLQQKIAQARVELIDSGKSVSMAKVVVEATDIHKEAQKQKARIEQIWEVIRIAKLRARLTDEEYKAH